MRLNAWTVFRRRTQSYDSYEEDEQAYPLGGKLPKLLSVNHFIDFAFESTPYAGSASTTRELSFTRYLILSYSNYQRAEFTWFSSLIRYSVWSL